MKSFHYYMPALVFGCAAIVNVIGVPVLRALEPAPPVLPGITTPVPLPDRNPARISPQPHPGQIKTAEWSAQDVQAATDRCAMMLSDTGIEYRFLAAIREGRCGAPAPIELSSIGKARRVQITPPARVTCGLAATLSAWADSVLQPAARNNLDGEITHIRNVASYVCRNRYNASDKPISEHARANALDMAAFKTQSGEWVKVLDHWALPPEERPAQDIVDTSTAVLRPEASPVSAAAPPPAENSSNGPADTVQRQYTPRSAFLYEIHAGACTLFGTVLGPKANEAHKDHFHYDLAERKHGAYCE